MKRPVPYGARVVGEESVHPGVGTLEEERALVVVAEDVSTDRSEVLHLDGLTGCDFPGVGGGDGAEGADAQPRADDDLVAAERAAVDGQGRREVEDASGRREGAVGSKHVRAVKQVVEHRRGNRRPVGERDLAGGPVGAGAAGDIGDVQVERPAMDVEGRGGAEVGGAVEVDGRGRADAQGGGRGRRKDREPADVGVAVGGECGAGAADVERAVGTQVLADL